MKTWDRMTERERNAERCYWACTNNLERALEATPLPGAKVMRNGRCLWRVVEYAGGLAWLWVGP